MKKPKSQPAIIEMTLTDSDNQISFAVRGSVEWLQEVEAFINYNVAYLLGREYRPENDQNKEILVQGREELIAAYLCLKEHRSYQGEFVKVTIAQEQSK